MAIAFGVCVGFGTKLGISVLHKKKQEDIIKCETIFVPLEDGDGCGIVEKYLIHVLVLFTDSKTTTEVNVTMIRVGSDEEAICQFGSIRNKSRVKSWRVGTFWVLFHTFQHFVQFSIEGTPFQYTSLLRNVPEFV